MCSGGSRTTKDRIDKQSNFFLREESGFQFAKPSFDKSPFRVLLRQCEGAFPGCPCLRCPAGFAAEFSPRGVGKVIVR